MTVAHDEPAALGARLLAPSAGIARVCGCHPLAVTRRVVAPCWGCGHAARERCIISPAIHERGRHRGTRARADAIELATCEAAAVSRVQSRRGVRFAVGGTQPVWERQAERGAAGRRAGDGGGATGVAHERSARRWRRRRLQAGRHRSAGSGARCGAALAWRAAAKETRRSQGGADACVDLGHEARRRRRRRAGRRRRRVGRRWRRVGRRDRGPSDARPDADEGATRPHVDERLRVVEPPAACTKRRPPSLAIGSSSTRDFDGHPLLAATSGAGAVCVLARRRCEGISSHDCTAESRPVGTDNRAVPASPQISEIVRRRRAGVRGRPRSRRRSRPPPAGCRARCSGRTRTGTASCPPRSRERAPVVPPRARARLAEQGRRRSSPRPVVGRHAAARPSSRRRTARQWGCRTNGSWHGGRAAPAAAGGATAAAGRRSLPFERSCCPG